MTQKVTILERTDGQRWSDQEMQVLNSAFKTEVHYSSDRATFLLLLGEWTTDAVQRAVHCINLKATVVELIDENFSPLQFDIAGCHKLMMRYFAHLT